MHRSAVALIFLMLSLPNLAVAAPIAGLQVPCTVERVIDGDSIKLVCTLFPGLTQRISVRVVGTDTPELSRAKCDSERRRAEIAKEFVEGLVDASDGLVILRDISLGKFAGRTLGDVLLVGPDQISLRQALITEGHARPYDGGKREGWCG